MTPPAAAPVLLKELDAERGQFDMLTAVGKLRDELTAVMMTQNRGNSREFASALFKLDEARQWLLAYCESIGSHIVIPRAEILQKATTDTTDTTDRNGVTDHV